MNRKKLIKEIKKIKNCFENKLLNESLDPPGTLVLGVLDSGSTGLAKVLGSKVASEIESSILASAKNSQMIMKNLGKKVGENLSFEDLKSLYGTSLKSTAAEMVLKSMGAQGSKDLDVLLIDVINPQNLISLRNNVNKITETTANDFKKGLENLQKQFSQSLNNPSTFETACDIMESAIPNLRKQLNDVELDNTLKQNLAEVLESFEAQINTHKFSVELSTSPKPVTKDPLENVLSNIIIPQKSSPTNLKSNWSPFTKESFSADFIDFNTIKFTEGQPFGDWLKNLKSRQPDLFTQGYSLDEVLEYTILDSIGTGLQILKNIGLDLSPIEREASIRDASEFFPITGFERYGTDNFRNFIIDNYRNNTLRITTSMDPNPNYKFSITNGVSDLWSAPFSWEFTTTPPVTNTKNQLNYNQIQNSLDIQKQMDKWDQFYTPAKEDDYNYKQRINQQKKDLEDLRNKGFYNSNNLPGMNESLKNHINKIRRLL